MLHLQQSTVVTAAEVLNRGITVHLYCVHAHCSDGPHKQHVGEPPIASKLCHVWMWIHRPTMHITLCATLCTGMSTYEPLVFEQRKPCQWSVSRQQLHLYIFLIRATEGLHRLQQVSVAQVQHCQLILQTQQYRSHLLPAHKYLPFINRLCNLGESMMSQVSITELGCAC